MPKQSKHMAPYPPEFRAEAIRLARTSGKPHAEIARELGMTGEALRLWLKQAELDEGKRKPMIWELQRLLHDDAVTIIPDFRDFLDAHNVRVGGHTPHHGFDLDNNLICEKAWLRS